MRLDAVLLAAGRLGGDVAGGEGSCVKALLAPGGEPMIERVARLARAATGAGRVILVGADEVLKHPAAQLADAALPGGASAPDNLLLALQWLHPEGTPDPEDRVLVVATDLPYLRGGMIEAFLAACPVDSDICMQLVSAEAFDRRFPDAPREYVRLRDGLWTIGCLVLVRPAAIAAARPHLDRVFRARKSQIGMARLLGPRFLLAWGLGRLTLEDIERRCSELLGCRGRAVRGGAPELAFDIDDVEDLRYVEAHAPADTGCSP